MWTQTAVNDPPAFFLELLVVPRRMPTSQDRKRPTNRRAVGQFTLKTTSDSPLNQPTLLENTQNATLDAHGKCFWVFPVRLCLAPPPPKKIVVAQQAGSSDWVGVFFSLGFSVRSLPSLSRDMVAQWQPASRLEFTNIPGPLGGVEVSRRKSNVPAHCRASGVNGQNLGDPHSHLHQTDNRRRHAATKQ